MINSPKCKCICNSMVDIADVFHGMKWILRKINACKYKAKTGLISYAGSPVNLLYTVKNKLQAERKRVALLSSELFKDSSLSPSNNHSGLHMAERGGMRGRIVALPGPSHTWSTWTHTRTYFTQVTRIYSGNRLYLGIRVIMVCIQTCRNESKASVNVRMHQMQKKIAGCWN